MCSKHQYAVPAFNINFQTQAEAVLLTGKAKVLPSFKSQVRLQATSSWLVTGLLEHVKTAYSCLYSSRPHL